jgi:hypothetical protein
MAKQQSFTTDSGVTLEECYWRVAQINIGVADMSAYILFYGYADAAKRAAGKKPIPGAQKVYQISGATFAAYYAQEVAKNKNLAEIAYAVAMETKDTPSGEVDEQGKPILESFFENAIDA